MNDEMRTQFIEALESVAADKTIRALVITGAGKGFISEDDLESFEVWLQYQGYDEAKLAPNELAEWRDIFDRARMESLATPKVADSTSRAFEPDAAGPFGLVRPYSTRGDSVGP